jgi:glycosyltransferase involved in cell wall biosynthesis
VPPDRRKAHLGMAPRPPRILFVANIGATLRNFVEPLAARLEQEGFETVAAAGDMCALRGFTRSYELPPFRRRGPREVARALRRLSDIVGMEQPDLVHLHTPPALVLGRMASARHGVRSVAVAHGSFLEPRGWRSAVYGLVEAAMARISTMTVTENQEDAAFYRRVAGKQRVLVAPVGGIGLDLDRLGTALRAPDRVTGKPSVVVVGRLTRDKNLDLAVTAFGRFRQRHPDATLTFVGSALPGEPAWTVPKGTGISSRPWMADPYPILAGADLVVSASRREGFALTLAEALALGVPAAAVSNRGVRQLMRCRVSALITCQPNEYALADAMEDAIVRQVPAGERRRLASEWSRENAIGFHRGVVYRALDLNFPASD